MKRYYLSTIVGTGTYPEGYELAIKRQHRELGLPGNCEQVMPFPARPGDFGLAIVATPNHEPLTSSPDHDPLPDVALDVKLSAIRPETWTGFVARAAARGIDMGRFSNSGNSSDAVRDVIRSLGQTIQPGFSENNFDAAE